MKCFKKWVWLMCIVAVLPFAGHAQKVGTTSMQFLKVMPSARATALGDAYSALATGAEAVFWNPSGLALTQNHDFSSTYINWIFDAQQGALAYAFPLSGIGAVGVQVQYVDYGVFEETSTLAEYWDPDFPGFTGRTFRPFSYLVGITYARSLTDRFSTGISIKYAHESLYNGRMVTALVPQGGSYASREVKTWGNGLLFDFGVRYNTGFRSIQIAASVQNFGAEITYANESSAVPLLFRLGTAANVMGRDALFINTEENRLTIAFDLFQPNDYAQQQHVGMEYEYAETFALRAGYKFNYDTEGLTLGAGIKHTLGSVRLSVDYSYGTLGTYLGNVQRFSLGAELQ